MIYTEQNLLWSSNKKIEARFTRLSWKNGKYIYIGLLPNPRTHIYTNQDYVDIMSYYSCIGYEEISVEEAKKNAVLPINNYVKFLRLEKGSKNI